MVYIREAQEICALDKRSYIRRLSTSLITGTALMLAEDGGKTPFTEFQLHKIRKIDSQVLRRKPFALKNGLIVIRANRK